MDGHSFTAEQVRHIKEENAVLKEQIKRMSNGEGKPRGKMTKKELESEATALEAELEAFRERFQQRIEECNILQLSVKELATLQEDTARRLEESECNLRTQEGTNQAKAERIATLEETIKKVTQDSKDSQMLLDENGKLASQVESLTALLVGVRAESGASALRLQAEISAREKAESRAATLAEKLDDAQAALRERVVELQAQRGAQDLEREAAERIETELAESRTVVEAMKEEIEGLKRSVADAQRECKTLAEEHRIEVEAKDALLAKTSTDMLDVKEQFVRTQTEIVEMMKARVRLQTEHAEWQAKRDTMKDLVDSLNARIAELEGQLTAQAETMQGEKAVVVADLEAARAQVAALEARVAALTEEVAALTTKEASAREAGDVVRRDLEHEHRALTQVRQELDDAQRRIAADATTLDAREAEVATQSARIRSLEQELEEHQEERMRDAAGWRSDATVTECEKCQSKFTLSKRKHHCRNCGHIFCNECSSKSIAIASSKNKAVRVCVECFDSIVDKRQRLYAQAAASGPTASTIDARPTP